MILEILSYVVKSLLLTVFKYYNIIIKKDTHEGYIGGVILW